MLILSDERTDLSFTVAAALPCCMGGKRPGYKGRGPICQLILNHLIETLPTFLELEGMSQKLSSLDSVLS
jgi:hypothetical protein